MCGRYQLDPAESREIADIIAKVSGVKTGEIFPTNVVPILMADEEGIAPRAATWGFPRFGQKSGSIINARSETAVERPMFKKSLMERRCVIPTTGFFEWGQAEVGKKTKYSFHFPGEAELYLAGIWNDFAGERRCVILTMEANASMQAIHNRMPVILRKKELARWVGDQKRSLELLKQMPPALVSTVMQ